MRCGDDAVRGMPPLPPEPWELALVSLMLSLLLLSSCAPVRRPSKVPAVKEGIYREAGYASWYGEEFHGRPTSSGEIFDMYSLTAAHRTLPLGTTAQVTDPESGKSVTVRINDRGPFVPERFLDLSYGAARALGLAEKGVAWVRLEAWPRLKDLSSRRYTVQVGAFLQEENARRLRTRMEAYGPSTIQIYRTNRGTFYRVRVGQFQEEEQANALSRKLRREGLVPLVVCAD